MCKLIAQPFVCLVQGLVAVATTVDNLVGFLLGILWTSSYTHLGHLARSCPSPAGPGPIPGAGRGLGAPRGGFGGGFAPRGGFAGGPRPATCYKCGGPNHFAYVSCAMFLPSLCPLLPFIT
jgi:hypothetical protein